METATISLEILDDIIECFDGAYVELATLIRKGLFTDYEVKPLNVESSAEDFDQALNMYYDPSCSIDDQRAHLRAVIKFTSEMDLITIVVPLLNSEYEDESILTIRKVFKLRTE